MKNNRSEDVLAVENGLSIANESFFSAEIEYLLENSARDKSDVKILPRVDMADISLLTQKGFEKKLSDIIKRALKNKKASSTRFLLILDFGFQKDPNDIGNLNADLYRKASVLTTIAKKRDYNQLSLLCFTKNNVNQIHYSYTSSKKLINKTWMDNSFLQASVGSEIHSIITELSENKLQADVELCYQAEQFIQTGRLNNELEIAKEFKSLVKAYEDKLSSTFYCTESIGLTTKANLIYFLSMLLGSMIFAGSRYAETWMVMSRDNTLLETSTLPIAVMRVILLLSIRPLESVNMLGAIAYGAKEHREVGNLLRAGWLAAVILSAITIPVLCTSEYWLQYVFRQNAELAQAAGQYLTRYAYAVPAMTISVADNNIFFATNNPGIVALIELLSVVAGVGLTYTFVFGKLGIPAQGLTGFATSLVIQKWMNFALSNLYLLATRNSRKYSIFEKTSMSELYQKLKLIFRNGLPLTFQIGSEQLYLFIVTIYAGLYENMTGKRTLDQANILNEYFTLFSISGGLVIHKTLIQSVGMVRGRDLMLREKGADLKLIRQNLRNVPRILSVGTAISLFYTAGVTTLFILGSRPLVSAYVESGQFTQAEISAIRNDIDVLFKLISACTFTEMAGNLLNGALNGLGDVDSPMLRSILLTAIVGGGLGAVLCFVTNLGLEGVYSSSLIAYTIGLAALAKTLYSTYNDLKNNTSDVSTSVLNRAWNKVSGCCYSFFGRKPVAPKALPHRVVEDKNETDPLIVNQENSYSGKM